MVRIISPDDMHSGNIWFLWSQPSNYQEKLRCHARDIRTHEGGGKWKIEQCSELNQKPQNLKPKIQIKNTKYEKILSVH